MLKKNISFSHPPSDNTISHAEVVAHEPNLLEQAWLQWQCADWPSLAAITQDKIRHHPDRSQLAILAAAGYAQSNNKTLAQKFIDLAMEWGADKQHISRILISGAYYSLCRISNIAGDNHRALCHCETSALVGAPHTDTHLLTKIRTLTLDYHGKQELISLKTNNQCTYETPQITHLYQFFIQFHLGNNNIRKIGFNTTSTSDVSLSDNFLVYNCDNSSPIYFISNESGNFNSLSKHKQLDLRPGMPYILSGIIEYTGPISPILWFFEYSAGEKINSKSIALKGKNFYHTFTVNSLTDQFAIGIRIAGQGKIDISKSIIKLIKQSISSKIEDSLAKFQNSQQIAITKAMNQIEACVRLQHYVGSDTLLPDMHNWPISPDFGVSLINLIETHNYDAVIEFGSGTSTLLIAKALQRTANRTNIPPSPFISYDHLEQYCNLTSTNLNKAGLSNHAQILYSELRPWTSASGEQFSYYSCIDSLKSFQKTLANDASKILIVVDGPPSDIGRHARFPAVPIVTAIFGNKVAYHFLLDDYIRPDEQETVTLWSNLLSHMDVFVKQTNFNNLEKKACLIEISPKHQQVQQ